MSGPFYCNNWIWPKTWSCPISWDIELFCQPWCPLFPESRAMSPRGLKEASSPYNQTTEAGCLVPAAYCTLQPGLLGILSSSWKHNTYVSTWAQGPSCYLGRLPLICPRWKHTVACDGKQLEQLPRKPYRTCSSWRILASDAYPDVFFILLSAASKPLLTT